MSVAILSNADITTKTREPAICVSILQESVAEYRPLLLQDLPVHANKLLAS